MKIINIKQKETELFFRCTAKTPAFLCAALLVLLQCSREVGAEGARGRSVSVCASPERWTVCFDDVCSCDVERWIYLSSILPPSHLDCIRINCTTSKSRFTLIPFLLLLLLLLPPLFLLFLSLLLISVSGCSCFECIFCGLTVPPLKVPTQKKIGIDVHCLTSDTHLCVRLSYCADLRCINFYGE